MRWRAGSSLPERPADLSRPRAQPANGAVLVDHRPAGQGDGQLELDNQSGNSAVVILSKDGTVLLSVAVAPGQKADAGGIPDGDYEVDYTSGSDWDANLGAFGRSCTFRRFTDPASFHTTPAPGGVNYTVHTVVIDSGPADASTVDIPPGRLPHP
jgi:hypothetical protein